MQSKGYNQTCVSLYGGGLWHTWFDRDLALAGKVTYFNGKSYETKLYNSNRAIVKIPNLAIHLCNLDERERFSPNKESHIRPILSTIVYDKLLNIKENENQKEIQKKHHTPLIEHIAKEIEVDSSNIFDMDLYFSDTQAPAIMGLNGEFISSSRLDNLISVFCSLKAIENADFSKNSFSNLICLFDHEECGSASTQGAASSIVLQTLKRIFGVLSNEKTKVDSFESALQRSFQISSDGGHSIHPNYSEKHQALHQSTINQGIMLKINYNQRYATDSVSSTLVRILSEKAQIPLIDFIVKNDSPCGSTIGPIVATATGIKTADLGAPMLSMHSSRETCGVLDIYYLEKLMRALFEEFENIPQNMMNY